MMRMRKLVQFVTPLLLPFMVAIFPALYHYGDNVKLILLPSLIRMLVFTGVLALAVYLVFLALKRQPIEAANAAFVFLIFYSTYGLVYDFLVKIDRVRIEQYTLLPFYVFLGGYACWLVMKLNRAASRGMWNGLTSILTVLVLFNLIRIVPAEIAKSQDRVQAVAAVERPVAQAQAYPDIYFIILDEYSGFEPMRKYWHNMEVDDFVAFLKDRGFFVAENSHASSINTLHLLSERLNYTEFPCCDSQLTPMYFRAISDNQVMQYLKAKGYTTVVFDETSYPYPTKPPVIADYSFVYGEEFKVDGGILLDEFGGLVANDSMLRVFRKSLMSKNPAQIAHRNMIAFTVKKVGNLDELPSPHFVYVHLMLPHLPFMFDRDGNLVDPEYHLNWNYYLGNYEYATKMAMQMVDNILADADPDRPPVIILQSDHGARNIEQAPIINLQNFPEEYKTSILFALRLPGYDTSVIPQDVKPINTFPIVFNHLFKETIPLK